LVCLWLYPLIREQWKQGRDTPTYWLSELVHVVIRLHVRRVMRVSDSRGVVLTMLIPVLEEERALAKAEAKASARFPHPTVEPKPRVEG